MLFFFMLLNFRSMILWTTQEVPATLWTASWNTDMSPSCEGRTEDKELWFLNLLKERRSAVTSEAEETYSVYWECVLLAACIQLYQHNVNSKGIYCKDILIVLFLNVYLWKRSNNVMIYNWSSSWSCTNTTSLGFSQLCWMAMFI